MMSGNAPEIIEQKAAVRSGVKRLLAEVSAEEKAVRSTLVCRQLEGKALWREAQKVLFYAPLPGEIDIWPLFEAAIREGKTVALPQYSPALQSYVACQVGDPEKEVEVGKYGIREPRAGLAEVELNRLDLTLVPGVAFDLHGRRLGRGKGFYDRLLREAGGKTCGVAFDEQVVSEVPVEAHDVLLNCILTPTRWIEL